jgi:hypothetical protein
VREEDFGFALLVALGREEARDGLACTEDFAR